MKNFLIYMILLLSLSGCYTKYNLVTDKSLSDEYMYLNMAISVERNLKVIKIYDKCKDSKASRLKIKRNSGLYAYINKTTLLETKIYCGYE